MTSVSAVAPTTPATDRTARADREAWWDGRVPMAVIAIVAAFPTLASTAHAGFVADDWGFLRAAEQGGNTWWLHGLDARFRPIQAAIHGAMFEAFRSHAAAALVAMALLEVVVALVLHRVARRFVEGRTAVAIALVWAALPNRSAPRLWISATPVTCCVLLLLCAALAASGGRRRPVVATALCCAAVLTYEAGVLVGALVIVWAWFDTGLERRDAAVRLARPLVVYGAFVLWNLATSPKAPSAPAATRSAFDGLVGAGLAPAALGGVATFVGLALVGLAVAGAVVRPSVRPVVATGALLALVGVLPLLVVGASPVVTGPVDRLNVIPLLGVAIVVGVGLDALARRLPMIVVALAAVAIGASTIAAQVEDVTAVNAARRDAVDAIVAFSRLPHELARERLVLDPGAGHRGWYAFGWDSAKSAIALRTGDEPVLRDPPAGHLDRAPGEVVVRVVGRTVVVADS